MATNTTVIESGIDQIQAAVRGFDRRVRRLQRELTTRRRRLGRELASRRRTLERRAQREVTRLRKQPLLRRAEELREGASRQLESGLSTLLDTLPIATKGDVRRIDRKVSQLNRKLRELERSA